MVLWILFAVLTAAVAAMLLRPLMSERVEGLSTEAADVAVFKDQLAEIAADKERGLITGPEAESARAEVARRLLSASKDDEARRTSAPSASKGLYLNAIAMAVPLLSVALYLVLGSPGMPGKPYVDPKSKPIEQASAAELVALVEARLRSHPEDARGWDIIAPIYLNQGRFAESADAYQRALTLAGESRLRLKGHAEATILANNGLVTEPARKSFARMLEMDANDGEAQFGLALAKEQDGKLNEAIEDYRRILANAPADARWKPALETKLARLLRAGGAPSEESAQAIAASKEEQEKFIVGMVERLAERLKTKGDDLAGWQQLVRSYKVLGRDADASAAIAEARRNFAGDTKALGDLDALAKSMGL